MLAAIGLIIGVTIAIAPYLDGPVNRIAGGPFKQEAIDFSALEPKFLANQSVVELEVNLDTRPSVEVAVVVHDAKIYIPATLRPEEKRWPKAILADPNVKLRSEGTVVNAVAHRVQDLKLHQKLSELGAQKYSQSYFIPENTWFFELGPKRH